MKRICVYCGSSPGHDPIYVETARSLGRMLTERGIGLVYGGARRGTMGELADAVLEMGGEVIGVIPRKLIDMEVAHEGLTKLHSVETMHERKALMEQLSDGFIALPGAYGTLDELFEILAWALLGYHEKPVGLVNLGGYYDHLLAHLERVQGAGFLSSDNRALLMVESTPQALLARMLPSAAKQ